MLADSKVFEFKSTQTSIPLFDNGQANGFMLLTAVSYTVFAAKEKSESELQSKLPFSESEELEHLNLQKLKLSKSFNFQQLCMGVVSRIEVKVEVQKLESA